MISLFVLFVNVLFIMQSMLLILRNVLEWEELQHVQLLLKGISNFFIPSFFCL